MAVDKLGNKVLPPRSIVITPSDVLPACGETETSTILPSRIATDPASGKAGSMVIIFPLMRMRSPMG